MMWMDRRFLLIDRINYNDQKFKNSRKTATGEGTKVIFTIQMLTKREIIEFAIYISRENSGWENLREVWGENATSRIVDQAGFVGIAAVINTSCKRYVLQVPIRILNVIAIDFKHRV